MSVISRRSHQGAGRQRGFTLIEALIAFVILSVGLLGIVSLQAMAKTSQHLALQHTRAVTIADAIVERIRVNPAGMDTYQEVGLRGLGGAKLGVSEPDPNCRDDLCVTPGELADYDLWAWERALDGAGAKVGAANTSGLIEPRGCIVFAAAPGKLHTGQLSVIIQWRGLQEGYDAVQGTDIICGDGKAAGADKYRRQVVTNTYVVDEKEF